MANTAQKVRNIREKAGLSQRAFAEQLGTNPVSMNRMEKGKQMLDLKVVLRLRDFYGVDLNWLLRDDDSTPQPKAFGLLPLYDEVQLALPVDERKESMYLSLPDAEEGEYFYRVRDEGMAPLVRTGDYVAVQSVEPHIGDLVLILTRQGIVQVRRLSQADNGKMLYPENPDYGSAVSVDEVKFLGRVIRVLRSFAV